MRIIVAILLICAFVIGSASEKLESPSYVTCQLNGQLGNQLFQIATTLAYAWDNNAIPVFPDLQYPKDRLSYNRDRIFFRLNASSSPRAFNNTFLEASPFSSSRIPFLKDVRLIGFFVSWAHFHHHRNRLLEVFAPSSSVLAYLNNKYKDLIENPKTVSIHVRTFNAQLHATHGFPFLGLEYYRKATNLFPPDTVFVVFSDRINWCKVHFPVLEKNFVFIEGNDAIEDLFLMSMMKHNIVANSSFSWWGAYLNQNPNKMIVSPYSWRHPGYFANSPPPPPNHLFFEDWIIVSPNYDEQYPKDMLKYDANTQSCDGN